MKNRLSRILKPQDGRTVMLAVDHGYFLGPTTGLENPWKTVEPLVSYADCLMPTRGILRSCIPPETDIPVVLRVSGGTSIVGPELLHEGITVAIDDALRLNACGLAFSILVGAPYERDTLLAFSEICDAGQDYGIPVLAVTAVGRDMVRDAKYLALASRIAAEIGAHMVKTYHCEGFERVVEGCPVPVVIAGGKKVPEREALQMAADAVQAGAVGVDMGRNIFQSENPVAMIRAVRAVVHENATADEAYQLFEQERGRD